MKLDGLLLFFYCGLIFMLSHQPTLPMPLLFSHQDKWVHASAYAVMAFFAWRAFRHQLHTRVLLACVVVVFCSLYGVSDEFHQSFVEGRDADVWDWLADTLGASMMAWALFRRGINP